MSFEQDPNEQANISGADLALMVDEIKRLKEERTILIECGRKICDNWSNGTLQVHVRMMGALIEELQE